MENRVDVTSFRWEFPETQEQTKFDQTPWIRRSAEEYPLTIDQSVHQVGLGAKDLVKQAAKYPAQRSNSFGDQVRVAVWNIGRTLKIAKLVADDSVSDIQQLKRWRYVLHGFQNLSNAECEVNESMKKLFFENVTLLNKYFELLEQLSDRATENDLSDRMIYAKRVDGKTELFEDSVANIQDQLSRRTTVSQSRSSHVQPASSSTDQESRKVESKPVQPDEDTIVPVSTRRQPRCGERILFVATSITLLMAMIFIANSVWTVGSEDF